MRTAAAIPRDLYRLLGLIMPGLLVLLALTVPVESAGQPAGYAGSFSRIGFSPNGIALANAMSGVAGEGTLTYYNPALAANSRRSRDLIAASSLMAFDRTLHQLHLSLPVPPSAGLTFSVMNAGVSGIDARSGSGYSTGTIGTNEFQLITGFGLLLAQNLQLGIGIKYYLADFHEGLQRSTTFGFDAGLLYRASQKLHLGLTIRDLLARYSWQSNSLYGSDQRSNSLDRFPVQVRLGAGYTPTPKLLLALEPGLFLPPSGEADPIYQLRMGGRYHLHERLTLRAGWQVSDLDNLSVSHNLSGGFSVHLPLDLLSPSIQYAIVPEPGGVSTMHQFGLYLEL